MGHFVVGEDATGIGIGKATLDHHTERQLPHQLFMRAVVGLQLQQADEVFFGCDHERTLAPADGLGTDARGAGVSAPAVLRLRHHLGVRVRS